MQKHATGKMPCVQTHGRPGVQVILHLVSLAEASYISAAPFLHVHMVLLDGVELGSASNGLPSEDAMTRSAPAFIAVRRPMMCPSSAVTAMVPA